MGGFWIFWTGQTISQIGSALTMAVLPLLVFKLSGSALNLGIASAATWLPYPLFGFFIGAWVDRVCRKRLMISLTLARALILALLPALALFGHLPLWWLYLVTFVNSTLTVGFQGATNAAVPRLVSQDELLKANGRIQASQPFAFIVGPGLAGVLLSATSLPIVLWVNAFIFVISAISLALIKANCDAADGETRPQTSLRQDILEGLRYVLAQPVLRALALLSLLANLAVAVFYPQIVLFSKEVLAASDSQVSQFFTAAGVGAVALMLSAGLLRKRFSYGMILLGSIALQGVCVLAMIGARLLWVDLLCFGLLFGLVGLYNVAFSSVLQAIAPNQLLGRIITFTGVVAIFSVPLSSVVGGAVIDQVKNVLLVFGILGGFLILLALAFLRSPLARVENFLPPAQPVKLTRPGDTPSDLH